MANLLWVKGKVWIAVTFVGIVKRTAIGVRNLECLGRTQGRAVYGGCSQTVKLYDIPGANPALALAVLDP
jgi:hypothetical protein